MVANAANRSTERYTAVMKSRWLHGPYLTVAVAAFYVVITIWMTWPLPMRAGSAVQDPGDPLFEIWVMRAVQHQLVTDPFNLYDANAFHPFEGSLAFSEEAISTALLGWPVYILTGNDVLAYNVMLLSAFWLVAFAVYLLAREFGASPGAALIAGVLASFAPARYAHLSHLHMLIIGWLPLALWALTRYTRGGRDRYLIVVGVSLTIQFLASLHMAVFSTLALGLFLPFLFWFERGARQWNRVMFIRVGAALVVPYLILAPTLLPHLHVGDLYKLSRPRDEIERLSATPGSYFSTYVRNEFWNDLINVDSEPFFPGLVAIVGALLAVLVWRRWWVWFAATLTVVAGILSLGFDATIAGRTVTMPYSILYDIATPIRNVRGVGRFGLLTALAIPLLAAFGYSALWRHLRERVGQRVTEVGIVLTAVLVIAACVELRAPARTDPVPNAETMAVYEWLADQPDGPVAEFPANGLLVPVTEPPGSLFQPIQYMYGSTRHWQPILSGYSGFIPSAHVDLLNQFDVRPDPTRPSFVTPDNVGILQELGIRWVVFHALPDFDIETALEMADELPELRKVTEVGNSVVYELEQTERVSVDDAATVVQIAGQAQANGYLPVHFIISNPHANRSILHLEAFPDIDARWIASDGKVAHAERFEVPIPNIVPSGETAIQALLTAPKEPGNYRVEISLDRTEIADASQQVVVYPAAGVDQPFLTFESIDWDDTAPINPGQEVHIEVNWTVIAVPEFNFAATAQLLNAAGERVAGSDLLPGGAMPSSSEWQVGEQVNLTFILPLDATMPTGEYSVLTAVYAYRDDYPRELIQLPDGTIATEVIVPGFIVGR